MKENGSLSNLFVFQILKYFEGFKVWTLASVFMHEATSKNLGS